MRIIQKVITYSLFLTLLLGPLGLSFQQAQQAHSSSQTQQSNLEQLVSTSQPGPGYRLELATSYPVAFAAPEATAKEKPYTGSTFLLEISDLLTAGFLTVQKVLWPVLLLIGPLLDNSLIFGPGVEDRLTDIWMQIRDITNFILAIMLVAVALYNLAGLGEGGNYELKSFFKKFILALVLVNFSFFGAKLVLDAANVLTAYTFSIPNTFEVGVLRSQAKIEESLCTTIQEVTGGQNPAQPLGEGFTLIGDFGGVGSEGFCNKTGGLSEGGKRFFSKISSNNLPLVMAANYSNISNGLNPSRTFALTKDLSNLAINTIISTLLIFMHGLAYISLFVILIVRLIFMWLAVALSPLIVFASVMGIAAFDELKKLYDDFFKFAFAPAKVGFALSISYILFTSIEQTGLSNPGIALGQQLAYPFSGVGSLEKLIISIASIVVVYEAALTVGAETRASFLTTGISTFARNQLDKSQGWLKRMPLGLGSKNSAVSLGGLMDSWNKTTDTINERTGAGDSSSQKANRRRIAATLAIPYNATTNKSTTRQVTDFVKNYKDPAYANLTYGPLETHLKQHRASSRTVVDFLAKLRRVPPASLRPNTPWREISGQI